MIIGAPMFQWMRRRPAQRIDRSLQDIAKVKRAVFERINRDRLTHGLKPVQWDDLASRVGDLHCREMLRNRYVSHWNLEGYKPYHRYSFAGGTDSVHENVSGSDGAVGSGGLAQVLPRAIQCHARMMAERPPLDGHRRNILDPITPMSALESRGTATALG
jgi:uncharacterized protein YkwD